MSNKKSDGLTEEQKKWMLEQAAVQNERTIRYKEKKNAELEEQIVQLMAAYQEKLELLSVDGLKERLLEHRRESTSENASEAELGKLCVQMVLEELRRRDEARPLKHKPAPAEVPGQEKWF